MGFKMVDVSPNLVPRALGYPCPAERENEDLWDKAFELKISLARNKACAILPEVRKTIILFPDFQIKPSAIDVEALGTIASSANMADTTPVKPSSGQQYVCRCCNSDFVSNPVDCLDLSPRGRAF